MINQKLTFIILDNPLPPRYNPIDASNLDAPHIIINDIQSNFCDN
jgi:hypothetical protein